MLIDLLSDCQNTEHSGRQMASTQYLLAILSSVFSLVVYLLASLTFWSHPHFCIPVLAIHSKLILLNLFFKIVINNNQSLLEFKWTSWDRFILSFLLILTSGKETGFLQRSVLNFSSYEYFL